LYDPKEGSGTYTIAPRGFVYQNSDQGCDGQNDFFDFVAVWRVGQDLEVFQYVADYQADENNQNNVGAMRELTPVTTITNASLVAGDYDRIKFEFENEDVKLQVRNASGTWINVINSASGTGADQLFKPIGLTTQALYPKIFIKNQNDNVEVTTYDGINNAGNVFNFYENKYFGLPTTGEANKVLFNCDTNDAFKLDADGDFDPTYTRLKLNASNGQNYKYVLIFAEDLSYNTILDGYLHTSLRKALGFKNNVNTQTDVQDAASTPNNIIIKSQETPKELGSGSLFVRVNNLPFNSLNGATESISQMLYACPRFDTNGNTTGGLYYEPAERTYLALNNPSEYVLSDISVDIVDINERVADDLEGNTIVTLHIRQAKK